MLQRGAQTYYWQQEDLGEIDFVVEIPGEEYQLIQVVWSVEDQKTLTRELRSFRIFEETFPKIKVQRKIIITAELSRISEVPCDVSVIPFFRWALAHPINLR